ncbi:uncharacterized protein RSE6_08478 [Rhynchosporium secalis]|uniref:Uncharacterized protein n=1 Tax=Rhynchosporium secalis TaxID=38038 RepID=A0A1E1MFH9_RHYSE|nr:uncharacterized protein RSE6_08478 [Rhynchosporium secalis]
MCSIHLSIDTFPEQCIISSLVIQGISTQTLENLEIYGVLQSEHNRQKSPSQAILPCPLIIIAVKTWELRYVSPYETPKQGYATRGPPKTSFYSHLSTPPST